MTTFRIIHISDLHISDSNPLFRYGQIAKKNILEKLANIINAWREQIDAVIITGDLSDTGGIEDVKKAANYIYFNSRQKKGVHLHN